MNDKREILDSRKRILTATQEGKWRFVNEIWGRPVLTPQQPAPPPRPTAEVLQKIDQIQLLNSDIRAVTDSYATLQQLAQDLRLLDVSPSWISFNASAQRYRAAVGGSAKNEPQYPELEGDRTVISDYHSLLAQSARAIKRAFFLAELMTSQFEKAELPPTRAHCLSVLADELEFSKLAVADLDLLLASYEAHFAWSSQGQASLSAEFRKIDRDDSWFSTSFLAVTRSIMVQAADDAAMKESTWPVRLPDSFISDYFLERARALAEAVRANEPVRHVTLNGLFLRATNRVPQFRGDPRAVTLGHFAHLLAEAQSTEVFTAAVISYLGYGREVEQMLLSNSDGLLQEYLTDLTDLASRTRNEGERVLLIIRNPAQTITWTNGQRRIVRATVPARLEAWLPSTRHGIFPVYENQLQTWVWSTFKFTMVLTDGFLTSLAALLERLGQVPVALIHDQEELAPGSTSSANEQALQERGTYVELVPTPPTIDAAVELVRRLSQSSAANFLK